MDYREILSFTLNKQSFIINHYHYLLLLSSLLLLLLLLLFLRMCAGASQLYLVCLLLEAIRMSLFVDSVIFLSVNGYVSLLARLFPPKKEVCYPNYGCFKPQKYLKHPQSPSQAGAEFNLFTEKNIFWSNF